MKLQSPIWLQSASNVFRFTPPEDNYIMAKVVGGGVTYYSVFADAPVYMAGKIGGRWIVEEAQGFVTTDTDVFDIGSEFYLFGDGANATVQFIRDGLNKPLRDFRIVGNFCYKFTSGIQYGLPTGNVYANSNSINEIVVNSSSTCKRLEVENCSALSEVKLGTYSYDYEDELELVKIVDCENLINAQIGAGSITFDKLKEIVFLRSAGNISFRTAKNVHKISFNAINSYSAQNIADLITAANSNNGTVYLNSADPYYSTVATAATNKGWTIEQLA